MALIRCNDCGRMVSEHATVCPGCGIPIAQVAKKNSHRASNVTSNQQSNKRKSLLVVLISTITVLLAALLGVLVFHGYKSGLVGGDKQMANDTVSASSVQPSVTSALAKSQSSQLQSASSRQQLENKASAAITQPKSLPKSENRGHEIGMDSRLSHHLVGYMINSVGRKRQITLDFTCDNGSVSNITYHYVEMNKTMAMRCTSLTSNTMTLVGVDDEGSPCRFVLHYNGRSFSGSAAVGPYHLRMSLTAKCSH